MSKKSNKNESYELNKKSTRSNGSEFKPPKHKCTDVICTIIFLLFIAIFIAISVFSYIYGKPEELILPHDSVGNICGKTEGYENKKNLFFFDITECLSFLNLNKLSCPTKQICVEKCPSNEQILYNKIPKHNAIIQNSSYCYINEEKVKVCAPYLIKSEPIFGRCVPSLFSDIASDLGASLLSAIDPDTKENVTIETQNQGNSISINDFNKAIEYIGKLIELKETFQKVFEDFSRAYPFILILLAIAAVISLIWLSILRFIIKPLVYISIIIVFGLLAFGTYFCVQEYIDLKNKKTEETKLEFKLNLSYYLEQKQTWLALSISLGIILLIFTLLIIFLRKRITFAVNILKEVSKAVISLPASFIWPVFPFFLLIAVIVYCCSVSLFLASSGVQLFKIVDTSLKSNMTTFAASSTTPSLSDSIATLSSFDSTTNSSSFDSIANLSSFDSTTTSSSFESSLASTNGIQISDLTSSVLINPINPGIDISKVDLISVRSLKYKEGDYCIPKDFEKDKETDPLLANFECYYYTYGYPTKIDGINSEVVNKYTQKFIEFLNEYQYIPQIYVAFMLFWLTAFVSGLNQMTLAGSFGIWYWTPFKNKKKTVKESLPFFTLFKSFYRALILHIGTIAFGALLIAIVKLIRLLLGIISDKLKSQTDSSRLAKFMMNCCKCCFWCLEKVIKFLNRYSFIITAVYSLNFCRAAGKAAKVISANVLRIGVTDRISNFILFLSNLAISTIIGVLSFYFFTKKIPIDHITAYSPDLNYFVLPLLVVIIGAYVITKVFFDVFSMGIDSVLICVLIDLDENDGSKQRPYFMSQSLRKVLNVSNNISDNPEF